MTQALNNWTILYYALPVAAFILGAVPFSFITAKLWKGVDVRKQGSLNPGASNVFRTAGPGPGIVAFILDTTKGAAPVFAAQLLADAAGDMPLRPVWYSLLVGFMAAAGHIWTPFLGFKGGKGVATFMGVFIVIFPRGVVLALTVAVVVIALTRYFSLGSLSGALILPMSYFLFTDRVWDPERLPILIVCCMASALLFVQHRGNIMRLIKGNEFGTRQK
ncbi:MAG: glycerol-3-phosphate 1-O-acyltransferase PlsY [Spirochaetia bacterium]|nr:glycerol-3-phosphate 1-O-acyltransferase PlsY [Spirochaetia bacterium]